MAGGEVLAAELTLGLEFTEFGDVAVEAALGGGAGALYGGLEGFGFGAGAGFEDVATTEPPGVVDDFADEGMFEGAFGGEVGLEGLDEIGPDF